MKIRQKNSNQLPLVLTLSITLALNLISISIVNLFQKKSESNVLGTNVSISAHVVKGCILEVTARPENRRIGNYATKLTVEMFRHSNFDKRITINTNDDGVGRYDLCAEGEFPDPGAYTYRVRAFSHLYKIFPDVYSFEENNTDVDLTNSGSFKFIAGDTNIIPDNKINSLDLSNMISRVYTDDERNDLNRDQTINSMDLSNLISNLFKEGE